MMSYFAAGQCCCGSNWFVWSSRKREIHLQRRIWRQWFWHLRSLIRCYDHHSCHRSSPVYYFVCWMCRSSARKHSFAEYCKYIYINGFMILGYHFNEKDLILYLVCIGCRHRVLCWSDNSGLGFRIQGRHCKWSWKSLARRWNREIPRRSWLARLSQLLPGKGMIRNRFYSCL